MKNLLQCYPVHHEFHVMSSRTEPQALWWETPVSAWTMRNWICNFEKKKLHSLLYHLIMLTLPHLTNHCLLKEYISFFTHLHFHISFTFKLLQMRVYGHDLLRPIQFSWTLESICNVKCVFGSKTLWNVSNKNKK